MAKKRPKTESPALPVSEQETPSSGTAEDLDEERASAPAMLPAIKGPNVDQNPTQWVANIITCVRCPKPGFVQVTSTPDVWLCKGCAPEHYESMYAAANPQESAPEPQTPPESPAAHPSSAELELALARSQKMVLRLAKKAARLESALAATEVFMVSAVGADLAELQALTRLSAKVTSAILSSGRKRAR